MPAPASGARIDERRSGGDNLRATANRDDTRMIESARQNRSLQILLGAMIVSLAALLLVPAIPQDQGYHHFADQRGWLGVPNFWNVASNLPFIAVGAVGVWQFHRDPATLVLFAGVLLTGLGSSYYHWAPSDSTLFWDRLPITITFMAIFAAVIEERVDARAGAFLLWPLVVFGVLSLLIWRWTDDLRLYAWVQFFPCLVLPVLFLLLPARYTGTSYWVIAAVCYVIAKAAEFYDHAIYATGVSGHTIKHLAAAAGCYAILRYYQTRRPLA
jgi:Ceramidase